MANAQKNWRTDFHAPVVPVSVLQAQAKGGGIDGEIVDGPMGQKSYKGTTRCLVSDESWRTDRDRSDGS